MPKLTTRRLYGIGVLVFVAALPLKTGGCGNTACITVTADQLAQASGACPSPAEAQQRLPSNQGCEASSTSVTVTGDGDLDGTVCCYPVNMNTTDNGDVSCFEGSGEGGSSNSFNGEGGSVSVGPGMSFASSSAAGGGVSQGLFDGGCTSCAAVLADGVSPTGFCTMTAQAAFNDLANCACGGPCSTSCPATFCTGVLGADSQCQSCLENVLTSGCSSPVTTCLQN
jgi:hypothetical protein